MLNYNNLKFALMSVVFLFSVSFVTASRTYLAVNHMDTVNGVYTASTGIETALYIVLAVSFVLLFVIPFKTKTAERNDLTPVSNVMLRISNIVIGAVMTISFLMNMAGLTGFTGSTGSGGSADADITPFGIAEVVTMALAIIAFFIKGVNAGTTKKIPAASAAGAMYIFPCLWSACRLANTFSKYTAVANIPENLFNILSLAGISLFLLSEGRFMADIGQTSKQGRLWTWSFVGALLMFSSVLPRLIVNIMVSERAGETIKSAAQFMGRPGITDFILAVYAITFALALMMTKSRKPLTDDTESSLSASNDSDISLQTGDYIDSN
ncbi:MAG: hypothetical protein FWG69_05275 [Oscillospiraceae bacterium]|nr:hypothetical protein [Oscillospiraceae bacterium]